MIARIDNALEGSGLQVEELQHKHALFASVTEALRDQLGRGAELAFWVPGRLEVFGKHTDYAGGRTLIATVPRGFALVVAPRSDDQIHVVDAKSGERGFINVRTGERSPFGWVRYIAIVAERLARNFPGVSLGLDIALMSDLPRAAGASSSSALTVGCAMAMIRRGMLDSRPEWRANITSSVDLAGYLACLENGMSFNGLEGGGGVGTFSGSEDHTAMICARAGLMSAYAFVPVRHVEDVPLPESWSFVVASSGVPAEKAGAAQALYNRASLSARGLLEIWNDAHAHQPSLGDALKSAPGAVEELRAVLEQAASVPGRFPWTAADLDRRLAHFVAEDGRVPEAVMAFRAGDRARLGAIAMASQRDAETLLDNQISETSDLATLARANGAWASCAFGAGFGGSVWALVSRADARAFGEEWMRAYFQRHPGRTAATWFVARPGPAMLEIST